MQSQTFVKACSSLILSFSTGLFFRGPKPRPYMLGRALSPATVRPWKDSFKDSLKKPDQLPNYTLYPRP